MPDEKGNYIYVTPLQEAGHSNRPLTKDKPAPLSSRGFLSFEFSYQLGVIRTRPGFAGEIASDINTHAASTILGTIPGNDTLLIIPREGVTRQEILDMLVKVIPGFKGEKDELLRAPK